MTLDRGGYIPCDMYPQCSVLGITCNTVSTPYEISLKWVRGRGRRKGRSVDARVTAGLEWRISLACRVKRWCPGCRETSHHPLCHLHFCCVWVRKGSANRPSPIHPDLSFTSVWEKPDTSECLQFHRRSGTSASAHFTVDCFQSKNRQKKGFTPADNQNLRIMWSGGRRIFLWLPFNQTMKNLLIYLLNSYNHMEILLFDVITVVFTLQRAPSGCF